MEAREDRQETDVSLTLQDRILSAPRDDYLPIGPLLETLRTGAGHQRALDMNRARRLANKFDPRAVGRLIVSQRADGVLWLLDGQHRAYAMSMHGIELALCSVFQGLTLQDEAQLWVEYNAHHMPRPLALYHGALLAQDPMTTQIDQVVRAWGYYVPKRDSGTRVRAIAAVGALRYAYLRGGTSLLSLTLQVISKAWHEDPHSADGKVIQGMAIFLQTYKGELAIKRLEQRLAVTSLAVLYQQAAAHTSAWGGGGQRNFALALVHAYNHGLTQDKRLDPVKIGRTAD